MQPTARAPQLLTGELWQQMSPEAKIAFVPVLVRGLQGKSINDVVRRVDTYYATHPSEIERPVIEAILQPD